MTPADGTQPRLPDIELNALVAHLAAGVSPPRDVPVLHHLVRCLAQALGADFVTVGELEEAAADKVRTLALFADGAIRPNKVYSLPGTPCEKIFTVGLCVYPENVAQLFPADTWLLDNGISSYLGAPLRDPQGSVVGVLNVMSRRPAARVDLCRQLTQIFADRAAMEIERQHREYRLEERNRDLLLLNELADNLHRTLNRSRLGNQALNAVIHHGVSQAALLYLYDAAHDELTLCAWRGVEDRRIGNHAGLATLAHHVYRVESGLPHTLETCPPAVCPAVRATLHTLGFEDSVVVPLGFMGRRLGALELLHRMEQRTDPRLLDTLRTVGRTLSLALVNADQFTEIEYRALHDPLTGLANRTRFHRDARQILQGVHRGGGMALLLLDIRRFGEINKTLGHHTGDLLLREMAARLRRTLTGDAVLSRLSGDEFAILLPMPDATAGNWVESETRRVLSAVNQPFQIGGMALEVRASIGIALAPTHAADSHALLRCADVALQRAKQTSGERVLVYERDFDEQNPLRLALMTDLTTAIRENQLFLHFQPKVRLDDGELSGLEALVRWQHPDLGLIPPGRFIPLVEVSDLIRPLTFWVLENTLEHIRKWRRFGLDVPVAVNLSPQLLTDAALPERLGALLARHDVPARFLELEITEGALMVDPEKALVVARELAALGVRLAIDDFGTGYSSLSYLKRLPLAALKIDRSFVLEMLDSEHDRIIVRSTIGLAHSLGLSVVAEGIETQPAFHALRDMGCDEGQGYCIARPESAAAIQRRLVTQARSPDDPCRPDVPSA
jgi:diguanylate cyclase (GGDEF)-like protein